MCAIILKHSLGIFKTTVFLIKPENIIHTMFNSKSLEKLQNVYNLSLVGIEPNNLSTS